ncbi:MAG: hypothetical protein HC802_17200, partial [Caldilineaceae bacterium]|nr:hypothetical protein [Caldilineaceae bacterium]
MRDEELESTHPLRRMLHNLQIQEQVAEIGLQPLGPVETARLVEQAAPQDLSPEEVDLVVHESQGNPLFAVEIVRAWEARPGSERSSVTHVEASRPTGARRRALPPPKVHAMIQA